MTERRRKVRAARKHAKRGSPAVPMTRKPAEGPIPKEHERMGRVLYFAYGSNLDEEQMRARCPSARAVARASLANYALTFGGFSHRWGGAVASVVRVRGARVEGLLYVLKEGELRTLDRFEGHPFAYSRVKKLVLDEHGRKWRASTYLQPESDFESWEPQPGYFRVLWRAYSRWGFDAVPLALAAGVLK